MDDRERWGSRYEKKLAACAPCFSGAPLRGTPLAKAFDQRQPALAIDQRHAARESVRSAAARPAIDQRHAASRHHPPPARSIRSAARRSRKLSTSGVISGTTLRKSLDQLHAARALDQRLAACFASLVVARCTHVHIRRFLGRGDLDLCNGRPPSQVVCCAGIAERSSPDRRQESRCFRSTIRVGCSDSQAT